jgi:hypothetical protein
VTEKLQMSNIRGKFRRPCVGISQKLRSHCSAMQRHDCVNAYGNAYRDAYGNAYRNAYGNDCD